MHADEQPGPGIDLTRAFDTSSVRRDVFTWADGEELRGMPGRRINIRSPFPHAPPVLVVRGSEPAGGSAISQRWNFVVSPRMGDQAGLGAMIRLPDDEQITLETGDYHQI